MVDSNCCAFSLPLPLNKPSIVPRINQANALFILLSPFQAFAAVGVREPRVINTRSLRTIREPPKASLICIRVALGNNI